MKILKNIREKWNSLQTKLSKEPKWVTVFQSQDEYIVRIYQLKLEDHGLPVMLFDQRDSSYNAFGYIYLHVLKKDEEKALELIATHDE